ncbi:PREDICTED: growth-regulating factor 3-like isoform X1 [Tarenaya hassleriana]|uniref:growth-regulating factor 3-like isoform X1 n=1 Tax=Tarenaya hassleriana TaxID=28532 RepID=UPI00053CAA66|nr:PREDICTED: growth-regulating factor 3-like isoform X1 [Tarenaya hassleriana]
MDLQLKQWRRSQQQNESEEQASPTKTTKLVFDQSLTAATSTALPLFAPEPETEPTSSKLSSLSGFAPDSSSRSPKFVEMRSFFSWNQWQELELQALIYRYMLAGAAVPQELLLPIRKSLLHRSPSYFLHHFSAHHQPPWYGGRAVMDPEPGRCRRTDGKKWRCSRDVVVGHKYCERHMHRGRNRSRKPVEIPTPPTATTMANAVTANAAANVQSSFAFGRGGGGGEETGNGQSFFFSSCPSQSSQLLNSSQSCSGTKTGNSSKNKRPYEASSHRPDGGHILRRFFDDWPRGSDGDSAAEMTSSSSPMSSAATSLTISMAGNPSSSSDVSLKLSTGNEEEENGNNGMGNGNNGWWGGGGSGGPLAEALRSSVAATSVSPTSVLHQLGITTQSFH